MHEVLVPVAKLEPGGAASRPAAPSSPDLARGAETARRRPGTPSGFYQTHTSARGTARDGSASDLGLALNDYLLGRLELSERDAVYESTRISLRRRADDRLVDLFELYWADLSRLGEGGWRALSAMYQLFFHLGTLAADVVDQVSLSVGGGASWRLLQRLHAWLAWIMKGPAALVQMAMLLVVLFGAAGLIPLDKRGPLLAALLALGAVGLTALAVLAWLHGSALAARWATLLLLLAVALACAVGVVLVLSADDEDPTLYFGASALIIAGLGAWLTERYARVTHGVRVMGHVLVGVTVVGLCADGRALLPEITTMAEWMLTAALNVGEWLLATLLLVWGAYVVVQIVALVLGLWLSRGADPSVKQSLHTSRLSLVGSAALYVMLSLVLWSVVSDVAGNRMKDIDYLPLFFGSGYRSGQIFLDARIQTVGNFFTPLVLIFMLLASATLLVLAPSLLEEISPTTNVDARGPRRAAVVWSARLGKYLSRGLAWLTRTFELVVPLGAIVGGGLYLAFLFGQFAASAGAPGEWATRVADWLDHLQGDTLVSAGKWLAGGAVTIAALGARFTQTFGRLRVTIDAVLDVDNYFRDPPDRQPPRARIYSRYASLLTHLRDQGYARLVIVSHSQGTVISTDLLRYLHVQRRLRGIVGETPISLVTVGSPLRDLYAQRFPLLYRWMGSNTDGFTAAGPSASDIGVVEWVNACRSGDYVGRFLWMPPGHPYSIAVVGPDGRVDADRAGDRTEFCLGAGAHTHYWSHDAVALAVEIDRLIEGRRLPG
ncbi:MAG TPA: hypothetical protein VMS64_13425 [Candidatus Methylomirabilis sp.]|nr:hypothetical protein [Candidatus Methylomirabilis sp.]